MKIDCIYVLCNKQDVYFANICIASIRYWNNNIPVYIIKDLSRGAFDTKYLEQELQVNSVVTSINNLGYFSKLYPFIEKKEERALILDSDIIWLCDLIPLLEQFDEDIVIDGYSPANPDQEKQKWYFFEPQFSMHYPGYIYPGFLFNAGQILINTSVFKKEEFLELLNWNEFPSTKINNAFLNDQGILNYLVAEKIKQGKLNYRNYNFHMWGWSEEVKKLSVNDIKQKRAQPYLVHWYGNKNGLISFLPGAPLLKFYEKFYYSHLPTANKALLFARLNRTIKHFDKFLYELLKKCYYAIFPKATNQGL